MKPLTQIVYQWALRCFGVTHVHDVKMRALRLAEEAIELLQASQVDKATAHCLIEVVYSRPPGTIDQELAGVLVCVHILCAAQAWDVEELFLNELQRVLAKPTTHFAKRNQEKIDLGLTA